MMEPQRTFLVIEPFGIIAEDLAMSISDLDATADIRIAKSVDSALSMVDPSDTITLAVLNVDPKEFGTSPLGRILAARNTAVILIGDAAELATGSVGFPVLHRPYAPETVVAMLTDILHQRNQARVEVSRA